MTNRKNKTLCRVEFKMNEHMIAENLKGGGSIKTCYYTLKAEKKISMSYEALRKAVKRHRPDLYELVRYGKKQVMTQQKTRIAPSTSPTVSGKKFAHQKTPRSNLFDLPNENSETE